MEVVCTNRKARFEYHIGDRFEAGIILSGPEVKSVRNGDLSIEDAFARFQHGELYLEGAYIGPYQNARDAGESDARRARKLLLTKHEIQKLRGEVKAMRQTIVPLRAYFSKRGFLKIEIALGKGKAAHDKRHSIKEREDKRTMRRAMERW